MLTTQASLVLGISLSVATATTTETTTKLNDTTKVVREASIEVQKPADLLHGIESQLVTATNAARARHGLPPLTVDMNLIGTSRNHTIWMTRSRSLQHSSGPYAENIAMGQPTVRSVIQSWMNSSGHRANMLNGRYRRIGVAAYRTSNGTIYWCQQFGW